MPERVARVWLIDIRAEIAGIRELTADAEFATFAESWGMKRPVEHGLLIIAEAAKHLPSPLKQTHPEVPWEKIHGSATSSGMNTGASIRRYCGRSSQSI